MEVKIDILTPIPLEGQYKHSSCVIKVLFLCYIQGTSLSQFMNCHVLLLFERNQLGLILSTWITWGDILGDF